MTSPETRELQIEGLAAGGRGLGRAGGMVWFVPGALPGDRVLAEVRRKHASYVEGRLVRRTTASPDRRRPPCPLQPECGGCPWMALNEAAQRGWKRRLVRDALERIGQNDVEVQEVRAPSAPLGYRNKVEFTLGRGADGAPAVGLHPVDPDRKGLVDVERCAIQTDPANAVLATARKLLIQQADRWLAAADRTPEPFRLVVRSSSAGEVLVALRETITPFPDAVRFAERLAAAHPELAGVVRIRALAGQRGGARVLPLTGRSWLEERIGEVTFRLPAASFLQVNSRAAELLLQLVREGVGRPAETSVIELYGGAGAFGVNLARSGATVTVCEADLAAVRSGREAARGKTSNVTFVHADVGAFLRKCKTEGRRADVVVADPPRAGLGRRLPEQIAALNPRRVVLVSCDPATLARDTRRLTAAGLVAQRAVPVDVFPQTAHVETVLTLVRA